LKEYHTDKIRNVCLSGHTSSGKTSLVEAILYSTKVIERLGRVDDGNTTSDYDPEEIHRKISINATVIPIEYKDCKINLIDLPGYRDFISEIKGSIRVTETMIVLMDATSGVEVGTEFAREYSEEYGLPRLFFINKMDKERANFSKVVSEIREELGIRPLLLTLPVGQEKDFKGVIDLVRMKYVREEGGKQVMDPIPDELNSEVEVAHAELVETAAEGNDELTMKYLDGQPLTTEEIIQGLKQGFIEKRFCPVFCGSACNVQGVHPLLNFLVQCAPLPTERAPWKARKPGSEDYADILCDESIPTSAFVYKTVSDPYVGKLSYIRVISGAIKSDSSIYNVNKNKNEKTTHAYVIRAKKPENVHQLQAGDIGALVKMEVTTTNDSLCDPSFPLEFKPTILPSRTCHMAISVPSKSDEEKIGLAMHKLTEQDETLNIHRDPEIKQTIIAGMGDMHLDVAISRLKSMSNVSIALIEPRVPYRETITKTNADIYRHKKQTGGRGQFGEVCLRLEPTQDQEFEFVWEVVGGNIPTKFKPSVEKGVMEAMENGVVAGYKVVNVRVACYDGKYHTVDSSDMAFKIAASMGFKKVFSEAKPIILEPIYKLKVTVPENYMGDVMGDLSGKRGKILGNISKGKKITIEALVALVEIFSYSRDLRSMTQGRGVFSMEFSHYEPTPPNLQEKIIEEAKQRKQEET
jgi:elongation factor G